VVLVSGVPGAGKSTLAGPLAAELGFALLAKDTIKEVLADALGVGALGVGGLAAGGLAAGALGVGGLAAGGLAAGALEVGALEVGALEAGAPELGAPELGVSRRLGAAAMELMWALAAGMPAVVLDANFWVTDERLPDRVRALSGDPVEVHCTCPAELAAQRYRDRSGRLHPIHAQGAGATLGPEAFARSGRPVGIGAVITADTAGPVDVPALAAAVRALLP
jgi:predicted kinase